MRHVFTHVDELCYECSACEEKFKNPCTARNHIHKVHNKQGSVNKINSPAVREIEEKMVREILEDELS